MANKYVGAAQFVGEKIIKPIVKSFTKKQKTTGTEVIKSVKPNVPKTKLEKDKSRLALAKQETKASKAKLNQAIFNFQEQNRQFKKAREKKMGGGMMGRRMGYSQGSNGKPISRSKNPGILAMSKTAKGRKVVKERFKFNPDRIVAKKGGKA